MLIHVRLPGFHAVVYTIKNLKLSEKVAAARLKLA